MVTARSSSVLINRRVYRLRRPSKRRLIQPAKPRSSSPARSRREAIIGERVNATTPDTNTAPARVNANSRNSAPVSPPWMPMGAYTAARVIVIAMIGPTNSRAASSAAWNGRWPSWMWRSTFSTTTMASSTTRPTASTMASSVSRLIVNPNSSIRNAAPMSEIGMATTGIEHRAEAAQEQEDHDDDDGERFEQRVGHLVDGVLDVLGGIVRHADLHPGGQRFLDLGHELAHGVDDIQRVGSGQHPDAHERRLGAVEAHVAGVVLCAEFDLGHVPQADDGVAGAAHHEFVELLGAAQVGVGDEVDGDHRSLGRADGGEVIVARERVAHVGGRDAERGHLVRLEPDAHGEGARAEDVRALHAVDRRDLGLHDAREVIGDLVGLQHVRVKAQVHRRDLVVGGLDVERRLLGLGRQVVAHLGDLGLDLGQGGVGVVVELEVDVDGAQPLGAGALHVVDALGARDDPFQGRREEAAHEVGVRADVDRLHADDRQIAARILPHVERVDRLVARQQDDEVDDDGQHGPADEQVGDLHASGAVRFRRKEPAPWCERFLCLCADSKEAAPPPTPARRPGTPAPWRP